MYMLGWVACVLGCIVSSADGPPAEKSQGNQYRVVDTFKVGGEGGWDYLAVDPKARRLYVTRSTHVMVLDADSGKPVGDIPDTPGVHGVALAMDLGRGFTSNGKAGTSTIFDLKSLQVIGTINTGKNPDAICYEPITQRVFVFNGGSNNVTVIDARTRALVRTIDLGGKPEFAVTDAELHLYVNLEDTDEVVSIEPRGLTIKARWPLAPGKGPTGLAIDDKNHRLFSVCQNKMIVVMDAETGKVLATPSIGEHPDGAGFDSRYAFSSNGEGTLTVVQAQSSTFEVVQTLPTLPGARTMCIDYKTHRIYLPTAEFGPAPAATKEQPRPRPGIVSGSFKILVVGR